MQELNNLTLRNKLQVISELSRDFLLFSKSNYKIPNKLKYNIKNDNELKNSNNRVVLLNKIFENIKNPGIKKLAFDTRRFDQETVRNPRLGCQNYVRSDEFISSELDNRLKVLSRLLEPLEDLKVTYGAQPEWHNSYSRVLYDTANRILQVKQGDLDIFEPQVAYLEQLMYNRYRLDKDQLSTLDKLELKNAILKKDEELLKKGIYLKNTESKNVKNQEQIIKTNNISTDLLNSIFGSTRGIGEKEVERVITITIKDRVVE